MPEGTIAGIHGLRVWATWLSAEDIFPTYAALLLKHSAGGSGTPNYAGLPKPAGDYETYRVMLVSLDDSTVELPDDDLACDLAGIRISRGRESIGEPFEAGTMSMTLHDDDGTHDPRRPPAGASRTGTKIRVEVDPELKGNWTPIFTGFVETWTRRLSASDGSFSEVEVECSDGFSLIGRAKAVPPVAPVGAGQNGSERVNLLLDEATWVPKWGARKITGGLLPMNPTDFSTDVNEGILDEIRDVTTSEDGVFYMTTDGTFYWYDRYWRGTRQLRAAVVDITGEGTTEQYPGMKALCPSAYRASDDDINMVNRAIVWRSTKFDPKVDGQQPEVIKKVNAEPYQVLVSISEHGLMSEEYGDLPHAIGTDDTVSQSLADRIVQRLAGPTNLVGDFELPLVKEYADAEVVVGLQFGDQILSWDDSVTGTPIEYPFEFVGIDHDITPDHWDVTLKVDRWVDTEFLVPTGVGPNEDDGTMEPAVFTPVGATIPPNLNALRSLGPLGQTTAWLPGQFLWLDDDTRAHWDGDSWEDGALGDPTYANYGSPGDFGPPGSVVPLNLDVLIALDIGTPDFRWPPVRWVVLQDGTEVWWDGTQWLEGRSPPSAFTDAESGIDYDPVSYTPATVAQLNEDDVYPVPQTPWREGEFVPLTGPEAQAHWNGLQWAVGASPGFGVEVARWDLGRWDEDLWGEP